MLKCQHQETDWSLELLLCEACVVLISVEIALRFRCWRPAGGGSAIAWAPSCSTLLPARLKCGCPTGSDLAIAWTLSWSLCILPAPPSLTAFAIAVCWLSQHDLKDLIQDANAERRSEMTTVSSDSVWCSDNRCTKFSNRRMEALAWVQIETFHRCVYLTWLRTSCAIIAIFAWEGCIKDLSDCRFSLVLRWFTKRF